MSVHTVTGAAAARLGQELAALLERVSDWPSSRWALPASPAGWGASRGDAGYRLVVELARLGCEAGNGAPAGAVPPRLGDYGLADQLSVVAQELLAAPDLDVVAPSALEAVLLTTSALSDVPPQPLRLG